MFERLWFHFKDQKQPMGYEFNFFRMIHVRVISCYLIFNLCAATKMKLLLWGLLMSSCCKMSPMQHCPITKYLIAIIYCHSKFMVKKQIIE